MSLLVMLNGKDKDPSPYYAELATYNWVLAIYSEIINNYGPTHLEWKACLETFYQNFPYKPPDDFKERRIFQKIFQSICLGISIRTKFERNYFNHHDIVGTISDFYYSVYNSAISFAMQRNFPENDAHGKNIRIFNSLIEDFPYPVNLHATFDSSRWNERILINQDHFDYVFSGHKTLTGTSQELINRNHFSNLIDSVTSQDILLGYLRGTVDWYIWKDAEKFKKEKKITRLNRQDDKNSLNTQLKKTHITFFNCLFRYRTKAHYRDFLYLTYNYTDENGIVNHRMDIHFYRYLFTISEFLTITTIIHCKKRLGATKTRLYLQEISTQIKGHNLDKYWELFI